ncbi:MAG TPA: glycosyltransferase family 2 protein [Candidatus Choladousia intestinavium]|uniref:Glycosyltransferase family 2 protein n=1 Tax=Candidatus Choladousia intestinavium TaxID=2840727 RepID=A0A9D1D8Y4_9FIRM|nr:glycosyltransferase family 2 protein [Candidatus Choladousia intestinavium]
MADNGSKGREEGSGLKPLVSVIIPAYRCAATISQALDSALVQEVSLEILVLNDQSPDELDQVMERYSSFAQIRYFHNKEKLGASGSRNRGVRLARGEYVAFLDADDWWAPGKLKAQLAIMKKEKVVLCATGRELVTPEGKLTGRVIGVREKITYPRLLLHNCINCSSVLLRTEVARENPMEHEDSHEDYILWLNLLKKYRRAAAVNQPLLKYRLSASGKSGNKLASAGKTYKAYRYHGFGPVRAALCFAAYSVNGVRKYLFSYIK